jgi:hypothetical protein
MREYSTAVLAAVMGVLLLAGCETQTKPAAAPGAAANKPKEAATVLYTGREAFQTLYATARMWTPDARPYRLQSDLLQDSNGAGGKAPIWRAGFASAARRGLKAFVWSGSHSSDAPSSGVSSGVEDTYNPNNSSTQVFDPLYLKIDSDKALEVAQQHGGDKLTKKDPKQPVVYLLTWNPTKTELTWHVIYGSSEADAKLRVAVNASTGVFERVEK